MSAVYCLLSTVYLFFLAFSVAAQQAAPVSLPQVLARPVALITGSSNDRRGGELLEAAFSRFGIRAIGSLDSLFLPKNDPNRPAVALVRGQGLPTEAADRLRMYAGDGGRVVLMGAVDSPVAEALGLEASVVPRATLDRMAIMAIDTEAFGPAPATVTQFPLAAATFGGAQAQPVARWLSATGEDLGVPAIVLTPSGAAISADPALGDRNTWQWLLLEILGRFDKQLLADVMARQVADFGHISRFAGYSQLVNFLSQAVQSPQASPTAQGDLTQATAGFAQAQDHIEKGELAPAAEALRSARAALLSAYFGAMAPRSGEVRAFFCPALPGQPWSDVIRAADGSGLNALFVHSGTAAVAYYPSAVIPQAPESAGHDPLSDAIAAASGSGLEVFAWHQALRLTGADPAALQTLQQDQRLMASVRGDILDWLCPLNPDNLALEEAIVRELAARPGVRGIVLDFLRYPNANYCYCPTCRKAFEAELGRPVGQWPRDVVVGPLRAAFREFRAKQLTQVLRALAAAAREANPQVVLSATVFPDPSSARDTVGQDWLTWAREGLMDVLCLLSYRVPLQEIGDRLHLLQQQVKGDALLLAGFRPVGSGPSTLGPVDLVDAIEAARRSGADGFSLYYYDRAALWDLLPALRAGPTRLPAAPSYDAPPVRFAMAEPAFSDEGLPVFDQAAAIEARVATSSAEEVVGEARLEGVAGSPDQDLGSIRIGKEPAAISFRASEGEYRVAVEISRGEEAPPLVRRSPVLRVASASAIAQLKEEHERRVRIDVAILEGGRGARVLWQGLKGLDDPRIAPALVASITPESLKDYDLVVISDPDPPWTQNDAVFQTLREWVIGGGALLAVHDAVGMGGNPAIFPEVGEPRPEGRSRAAQVEPRSEGEVLLEGLSLGQRFSPRHEEHVAMRRGALGRVLLADADSSDPEVGTLLVGQVGEGRVVLCGLALGLGPHDEEVPPIREELTLLGNAVHWLGRSNERVSALEGR